MDDILSGATVTVPAGHWWPVDPTGRPAPAAGAHQVTLQVRRANPPSQHAHSAGCGMPSGRYQTLDARVVGGDGRTRTFMVCLRTRPDVS